MGFDLIKGSKTFRNAILECDRALASLDDKPSWSIAEELSKEEHETNIYKAEYSQPMCTAIQLGLVAILNSWGLSPDVVVGHSSGEIAAAYAAGLVSVQDTIINAYYRGLVLNQRSNESHNATSKGSMCAVGLSDIEAAKMLKKFAGRVKLAAINSQSSCTLSGDCDAIKELIDECNGRGCFCRELRVDVGMFCTKLL